MLLRSYGFTKEVPSEVWELFKEAENVGDKLDYTLEIIDAAMRGDINTSKKFNLGGYIYRIEKHKELERGRKKKKVLGICDSIDEYTGYEVPVDNLTGYVDQIDEFEKIENDEEVKYAVDEINKISSYLAINNHIDFSRCVRQALRGTPESINLLKDMVSNNPHAGNMLKIILESGREFDELF